MKRTGLAFLLFLTVLTGCVHSRANRVTPPSGRENTHLLYLQPKPHRSLYVEVDAVEGAEFSDAELSGLKAFLSQWCEKPDGVTVLKSSVIARSTARGHSADSLARRYLDGPTVANAAAQPAYLYILVYDNRVNQNPVQSSRGASQRRAGDLVPLKLARPESPHVVFHPYPAMIYIDRSWLGGLLSRKYWYASLIHEVGHVLGLVNRDSRVEGSHCPTNWCVMNGHVSEGVKSDVMNWLRREKPKPTLCEACATELRRSHTSEEEILRRFAGPALVRRMPSYQVLSLPQFSCLCIDDSLETVLPKFIEAFRTMPRPEGPCTGFLVNKSEQNEESRLQAIEAAKQDVDPAVRAAAVALERHVREQGAQKERNIAEPDGAANGSQPIRSETNRTSGAAGPRR